MNLEYDQALRQSSSSRVGTAALMRAMIDEGYRDQLMLGTDGARRTLWSTFGGEPGLAWLTSGFRRVLRSAGVDDADQRVLFIENPRRFLTITSSAASRSL